MKKMLLVLSLLWVGNSIAQTIPTLAKEWVGTTSLTMYNAAPKWWNFSDKPASLTVMEQQQNHLDLVYKSGNYETRMVGTISADGSTIQLGNTEVFGSYTLRDGRLVGCGSKRGGSVVYDSATGSYATWCDDLKAAK